MSDHEAEPPVDPYTDCTCGHGRHTHTHYTGGCGLCACSYLRPPKG